MWKYQYYKNSANHYLINRGYIINSQVSIQGMNSTNYDNLRWCDRFKNTQVYHHVQAFAKKIRKKKKFNEEQYINANAEQREIDVFYKEGWEYQHAHSSLSCDISDPIYLQMRVQYQKSEMSQEVQETQDLFTQVNNPDLLQYYRVCRYFIQRLKTEHQDETAFRVQTQWILPLVAKPETQWNTSRYTQEQRKHHQNLICARQAYRSFFDTINIIVAQMIKNIQRYVDEYKCFDTSRLQAAPYLNILGIYYKIERDCHILRNPQLRQYQKQNGNIPMDQWIQQQNQQVLSIHQFMAHYISIAQKMKQEKKSCLFNFQPQMPSLMLTYIIHPLLLSIYAHRHKQRITWENQYEHNIFNINFDKPIGSPPLEQDTKFFQISRTLFINLDGYQSQFNIQLAKNMQHHLMYISFPKIEKPSTSQNLSFNNRFFKKILFKYSRDLYENDNQQYDYVYDSEIINKKRNQDQNMDLEDDDYINLRDEEQMMYDPEKYYSCIDKMYHDKSLSANNKNIYVIPLSFKYLQQQLKSLFFEQNSDASINSSYFIQFLFQDFLYRDIRKFNPNKIIISYSGHVNINDEHFIKIIQQLSIISQRRVMLFPNFSTKIYQVDHENAQGQYDNYVKIYPEIRGSCNLDLMKKMSQFLKITSGTYNLQIPVEITSIIPRYKLCKLNNYIRGILKALSNQDQYQHLKSRVSDLFLQTENQTIKSSIQQNIKQIRTAIPVFYRQLIGYIRELLTQPAKKCPASYRDLVEKVKKNMSIMSEGNSVNSNTKILDDIQNSIQLEIVSEKYSEVAYIYIKTKPDKQQYITLKQENFDSKSQQSSSKPRRQQNNLTGMYSLSLKYTTPSPNKQKLSLPIYPKSQLLYRQNQVYKTARADNKNKINVNIMLMNHLEQGQFISYAGYVPISLTQMLKENKIIAQRAEMFPIRFLGMPQLNNGGFTIRCAWNYAETNRYYFIFWPLQYNFVQAKLRHLQDQVYEPNILNEFYISSIPDAKQYRLTFSRVDINNQEIIPRKFCSCLQLINEDKIIILGGFYSRQQNYLSLQTDITGVDASNYSQQNQKCVVTNQKGTLYKDIKKKHQNSSKTNSYIRARRQYNFYQLEQLCNLTLEQREAEGNVKTYVMIGGYGDNFVRPYSLLTCFYYMIRVDMQTRSIKSIDRNMVYQRFLTSNIKGYIKNKGYFQKLALFQKNLLKPDQQIGPEQYIAHRSIFALVMQNNQFQLKVKTKYFFALPTFNNFKKQYLKLAKKIGEYIDQKTNDTSQFLLSVSAQGNHFLVIRKNKNQEQIAQIYYQKTEPPYRQVSLTHQTIKSIDVRVKLIHAIIKHPSYTKDKYVLAQCQMPNQQADVVLRKIHQFNENLQQFYLFSSKPNEILLLHGLTFKGVNISDFVFRISKKQNSKEDPYKAIQFPDNIESQRFKKCFTVMLKDENRQHKSLQIENINLIIPNQVRPKGYPLRKYRLKLNQNLQFFWQATQSQQVTFSDQYSRSPLFIHEIIECRQLYIAEVYNLQHTFNSPTISDIINLSKQGSVLIKVGCLNKQTYIGMIASKDQRERSMEEMSNNDDTKIVLVNAQLKDAKKIWQMSVPLTSFVKSIVKYESMDISIQKIN